MGSILGDAIVTDPIDGAKLIFATEDEAKRCLSTIMQDPALEIKAVWVQTYEDAVLDEKIRMGDEL